MGFMVRVPAVRVLRDAPAIVPSLVENSVEAGGPVATAFERPAMAVRAAFPGSMLAWRCR